MPEADLVVQDRVEDQVAAGQLVVESFMQEGSFANFVQMKNTRLIIKILTRYASS